MVAEPDDSSQPERSPPRSRSRVWVRTVLSLLLAGAFVWMLQRGGLPIVPPRPALAAFGLPAVLAYAVWFGLLWVLRVHRWSYLLRPLVALPRRESVSIGLVGAGAIVLAPARLGELVRPYLVAGRGVSFTQAAGIVGAERVVDGVMVASMLTIGLLTTKTVDPLPDRLGDLPIPVASIPHAAWTSMLVFAAAFAAMAAFFVAREQAKRLVHTVLDPLSPRAATFVADTVARLADGLSFLRSPRDALPFLRDTVVYWGMNIVGLLFVLRTAHLDVSVPHAMVMLGVISLGIMVPAGPGFFGAFQLSGYCALALFFPLPVVVADGGVALFVIYTVQTVIALLGGVAGVLALPSASMSTSHSPDPS